jgi:hypothetical protein
MSDPDPERANRSGGATRPASSDSTPAGSATETDAAAANPAGTDRFVEFAVVIPAFRAEATIARAVRSALDQTLTPREVIVVDDGSKDDTAKIAAAAGARVIEQENAGPGAARNAAVRAAHPDVDWIAFLDADDQCLPERLAFTAGAIRAADLDGDPLDAVGADAWAERPKSARTRKNAARPKIRLRLSFDDLLADNPLICSTTAVRRATFDAVGGFDEDRDLIATEDFDLWLRLLRRSDRSIFYIDLPLGIYDASAGSLGSDERFVRGVDKILLKQADRGMTPEQLHVMRQRRATMRMALAWQLARDRGAGAGRRARAVLAEAGRLGAPWWPRAKVWLRSLMV